MRRSFAQTGLICLGLVAAFSIPGFSQGIITTIAGTESVFPAASLPALQTPLGPVSGVAAGIPLKSTAFRGGSGSNPLPTRLTMLRSARTANDKRRTSKPSEATPPTSTVW